MIKLLQKGHTREDGTYLYTCGCGFKNPNCYFCHGGDLEACQVAIKTARGQMYYGLLKTILSHVGKTMVDDFKVIRDRDGSVTVIDVAWLSSKYKLNFKATCEWLEETHCLPSGMYDHLIASKIKVKDLLPKVDHFAFCNERGRHDWYLLPMTEQFECQWCGKKVTISKLPMEQWPVLDTKAEHFDHGRSS